MRTVSKTALAALAVMMACAALLAAFAHGPAGYAKEYNLDFDPSYGYGSLDENMKRLYDDMVSDIEEFTELGSDVTSQTSTYGAINYKPLESMTYNCAEYGLDYPHACSVFSALRLLHPEYYFLPGMVINVNGGESVRLTIISDYAEASARAKADDVIERAEAEILTGIDDLKNDFDKVMTLHDRIINSMDYAWNDVGAPESAHWAHSIIGAVSGSKTGTCETYAKWFSFLLLESGIENYIVTGTGRGQNHAWNIIKLDDGKWYDFDLTWDDQSTNDETGIYYGYFAIPSSIFDEDHDRTPYDKFGIDYLYRVPEAENTYKYCYYGIEGSIADCSDDDSFFTAYAALWKKAIGSGDRIIRIFAKSEEDLQYIMSKYEDLDPVREKLNKAGIKDDIGIDGGAVVLNDRVVCIYVTSSSFCPNAVKHSYTAQIPTDEYLKSSATCKKKAVYYYACEYCGQKGVETYEYGDVTDVHRLSHTAAVEPDCESGGNTEYWYCRVCGKYFADKEASRQLSYDNDIELAPYGHTYVAAESTGDKEHRLVCERCQKTITEAHKWDDGKVVTKPSMEQSGIRLYTCKTCGAEREEEIPYEDHVHSFSESYSFDEENHWRECSCGEKSDLSEHEFEITASDDAETVYTCTVCGYEKTVESETPHVHEYGDWEPNDSETHVRRCADGDSEETAPHSWTLTDESSDGSVKTLTYTCAACGATKHETENETPAPHVHEYGDWQPYDPEAHRRVCIDGDSEETAPHDFIVSDVNTAGYVRSITYVCSVCGETFTETEQLPNKTAETVKMIVIFTVSTFISAGIAVTVVILIKRKKNKQKDE